MSDWLPQHSCFGNHTQVFEANPSEIMTMIVILYEITVSCENE